MKAPANPGKTLLVGWDGADWSFLRPQGEKGSLPALSHLARTGVSGDLQSLSPYLSPMLWNSIATGKRPWKHGIHGFTEVDAAGKVRPISSTGRRVPALWNILSAAGLKTHVVGWFASHPAEMINGVSVSEAYFQATSSLPTEKARAGATFPSGAVFPPTMGDELADLRVKKTDLDLNLLRLLIPEVTKDLLQNDPKVGRLALRMAELYSVHNVMASLLETEAWNFAAVYFHFVDWVLHDFAPYVPPKAPQISNAEFRRYSGVVEGACRLQDTLLAELVNIAGRDTRIFVVSDHGFQTGAAVTVTPAVPAGIAAHHRPQGIFTAWGPGIRKGEHIRGASLLDITPTILRTFGLPAGTDMDGRVLEEIFENPPPADMPLMIPTWDNFPSVAALIDHSDKRETSEDTDLMARFIELGYVDAGVLTNPQAAESQRIANGWNVGMDLYDAGRPIEALPLLEEAHWFNPELAHYTFWLARCQAASGLRNEAWQTAQLLNDFDQGLPALHRYKGLIALETGKNREALQCFDLATRLAQKPDDLPTLRALAMSRNGNWADALEILQTEVTRRPTSETWIAILQCYLQLSRPVGAIAAARQLLLIHPWRAQSHFFLAQSLLLGGEKEEAWTALTTAQNLRPGRLGLRALAAHAFPERAVEWQFWGETAEETMLSRKAIRQQSLERKRDWNKRQDARRQIQKPVFEVGKPEKPKSSGLTFTIVSGLPRSGTSMLMQMLRLGGLEPMTDEKRPPDIHNPQGFFEWEPIRRLSSHPTLIEQCGGKVVKVISALVPYLPWRHSYDILAITRIPVEIEHSQFSMLGKEGVAGDGKALMQHQEEWLKFLRTHASVRLLELEYGYILQNPIAASAAILQFLGPDRLPHADQMAQAVRPELHRNRHVESK